MKYSQLIDSIAYVVHEKWKKDKLSNGKHVEDWQTASSKEFLYVPTFSPKYIRKDAQGVYEVDKVHAPFTFLTTSMKKRPREIASLIVKIAEIEKEKGSIKRDNIGKALHEAWNRAYGETTLPYSELPFERQQEYLSLYDTSLEMSKATDGTRYSDTSVDEMYSYLANERAKGNNIYYETANNIYFSMFDTEESCYLKSYGKTKQEVRNEIKLQEERRTQQKASAQEKIPALIEKGFDLMHYKKYKRWVDCVKERVQDIYLGHDIEEALQIMEGLEKGMSFDEANEILKNSGHTGGSYASVINIVVNFSRQGPAFYRHITPQPYSYNTEEYLQKIEKENEFYKQLEEIEAQKAKEKAANKQAEQEKDEGKKI